MNNNLSEFLKFAKDHNRIKEINEAFDDYPVEDEWHMGRIENVIKEEEAEYNIKYCIGDIVFVKKYTYENGEFGKNHLFVIIDQDNTAVPIENFGMLISSNLNKLKFESNILLEHDENNNLKKDSLVKTDVLYKILDEQILFKIGNVDEEKIEEYKRSFYEYINTSEN